MCKQYQQKVYSYNACLPEINESIKAHLKEGLGIRSIARLLCISPATVMRKILRIASEIKKPPYIPMHKEYQMDELRTYIGKKKQVILDSVCHEKRHKRSS